MNLTAWREWGACDPEAQHEWAQARDRELARMWTCERCGCGLPRCDEWGIRLRKWLLRHRLGENPKGSSHYCDDCASARESGMWE